MTLRGKSGARQLAEPPIRADAPGSSVAGLSAWNTRPGTAAYCRLAASACRGPAQGVYLAADRARAAERHAPGRHRVRAAGLPSALLDDHREPRVLAPDDRRDAQRGVEPVQHHFSSGQHRAPLPALKRARSWVTARPGAEGDVEPRILEQGEVRDRQGWMAVLDQQPGMPPGRARRRPYPPGHPLFHMLTPTAYRLSKPPGPRSGQGRWSCPRRASVPGWKRFTAGCAGAATRRGRPGGRPSSRAAGSLTQPPYGRYGNPQRHGVTDPIGVRGLRDRDVVPQRSRG
jgi:hypothetical protein